MQVIRDRQENWQLLLTA